MNQVNTQTQEQVQTQQQVQTLSAQHVMAVRLTEMSLDALQQRVENECLENPWLEKQQSEEGLQVTAGGVSDEVGSDEISERVADYRTEDDIPEYLLRANNGSNVPENVEYGDTLSFYDQLKTQMAEYDLNEHEQQVMEYLIGSLDDDGLLKKSLPQLADELEIYQDIETSEAELERLLQVLWQFDPPGIGARSLQECLILQIRRDTKNPMQSLMLSLMTDSYDDFIHKRWDRIKRRMRLSDSQFSRLQREIVRLNPRPGNALGEKVGQGSPQVTPDFIVETDQYGRIIMTLNEGNVPQLVISPDATEKIKAYESTDPATLSMAAREDLRFTRSYVERGQMFINALAMRRESMMRTMRAIIQLQEPFFLEGDESLLRPMILKDVSERSGESISVVSRVCNSKYVQTSFGTWPLKWFFSQKSVQNDGDVSARKVMASLRQLVEEEDRQHPLSDERLTQMLEQQGYRIARRTVAKYREMMGIPVARLRR